MSWWVWMVLGLLLAVLEIQVPANFYLLAVGIAAILVGAIVGLFGGPSWFHWLSFSLLAVAAVVVIQRYFLRTRGDRWSGEREIDNLVGEVATPVDDLAPGAVGKAELRGTTWNARNAGEGSLTKGRRCRVERVEGLTLWIRAE